MKIVILANLISALCNLGSTANLLAHGHCGLASVNSFFAAVSLCVAARCWLLHRERARL